MKVIPAIDIYDKKCVRLVRGKLDEVFTYPGTPAHNAQRWEDAGAERLHVVDINAAKIIGRNNLSLIKDIVRNTSLMVQVGGGIRTKEAVLYVWKLGVNRVILGTAAVTDRALVAWAAGLLKEALVVGVDAQDGIVMVDGWEKASKISARDLLLILADCGVQRINYTDTGRDGTLGGPNFKEIEKMMKYAQSLAHPIKVTPSGGSSSIADLVRLQELGVDEAIVGRALYENKFDLGEAIAAVS